MKPVRPALLIVTLALPVLWIANGHAGHDASFPMPRGQEYVEECGACHAAYAPGLLPARSWVRMMAELDRHFGGDASIDPVANARILTELRTLAADSASTRPMMRRIADAIPPGATPQRITETSFFRYMHDEVPTRIWKRTAIGSPANCDACHGRANEGRYAESEVRIPK